jgi:hypothetical protein
MKKIFSIIVVFTISNNVYSQNVNKDIFLFNNRILNESLDLNLKWSDVKLKCNFNRIFLSQNQKNEFFLENLLYTPQKITDTFNKHSVYFKAFNEKSKILFGEKFDNLFIELEITESMKYNYKPGGNISINFHKKFNNVSDSKLFYLNLFKKIENITKIKFSKDAVLNNDKLTYNFLSDNGQIISLFNYNNIVLLNFLQFSVDDSWPTEINYDEFSDNFKLADELFFYNGFRLNRNISEYANVVSELDNKINNKKNYRINENYRKIISGIQFEQGVITTIDNKINRQIYFIKKNQFNDVNSMFYYYYLNKLISEFGFGFLNNTTDTKIYYWSGKNIIISFTYNILDETFVLLIESSI